MGIKRLHQLVAKQEVQSGKAPATFFEPTDVSVPVGSPVMELAQEPFERSDINRESLSPLPALAGITRGTCSFNHELTGHRTAGAVPPWFKFIEACGYREAVKSQVTLVTPVGTFLHGERLTDDGGTTWFGRCIHDTFPGMPLMYELLPSQTSPASGATIDGEDSGATAETSGLAADAHGFALIPSSIEKHEFLTLAQVQPISAGDVIVGQTNRAIAVALEDFVGASVNKVRYLSGLFIAGETLDNETTGQVAAYAIEPAGTPGAGFHQTDVASMSLALIEDGRFKQLRGCRGSFSIAGEIGQAALLSYNFQGLVEAIGDKAPVLGAPRVLRRPTSLLGVTIGIGKNSITTLGNEFKPRLRSFSFDVGKEVAIPDDMIEPLGIYDAAHIIGQSSTGTLQLQVAPELSFGFLDAIKSGELLRVRITIGAGNGTKFTISTPAALPTGESSGEANGFANFDLALRLSAGTQAGEDRDDAELVITYDNP